MAERKFDYENVGAIYKNMQNITGDESNADSIAGILHNIDEEFHNKVEVCEEAIFGDLGKQLLLDWDNTSSCFPSFVTNFSNWSTLIAQSAGNYAQFEQDIKGFNQDNPLGVTSGGITDAYTNTGYYSSFNQEYLDTAAASVGSFVSYNGLGYIDTNMVAIEKQRKTNAMISFGVQTVATILSLVGLKKAGVFKTGGATQEATKLAAGSAGNAAKAGTSTIDELVTKAPSVTKDKVAYVDKLIKDGTINNADDFLKFFGGSESAAKTAYTAANGGSGGSAAVRNILNGFSSNAGTTAASTVGAASNSSLINTAKSKLATMSDDAIAKVLGLSKEQVEALAIDGSSVRQYALQSLGDTKIATAFANFGSKVTNSSLINTAKSKLATMSDDAIAKVLGLSKETVEALAIDGSSVRQYALQSLGNTKIATAFANFGSKVSSASSSTINAVRNVHLPGGTIPTALGVGTNLVGQNLLSDIDYENVTITSSPYAE